MKKYSLKYASKCKICGRNMAVGAEAWMQKGITGKWEIFCPECIEARAGAGGGMAPPPAGVFADDDADIKYDESALAAIIGAGKLGIDGGTASTFFGAVGAELDKKEPEAKEGPKMTLDYIKANAAWKLKTT